MTNRQRYSKEFAAEREAEQAAREAELDAARRENEAIRAERRQRLEAEREAKRLEAAAAEEAELAPVREAERRLWLIDHPDKTDADFGKVWPLIREQRYGREALLRAEIEAQRRRQKPVID